MRALVRSTEAAMDDLCDADVELLRERVDDGDEIAARRRRLHPAPSSGLRALLTRRELEVLELMAEGMTNAAIGQLLVISEGTVKSHVKHILRKLRAANRADAVSRFMRMTGHGDARS